MKYLRALISIFVIVLFTSWITSVANAASTIQLLSPAVGDSVGRHTEIRWIASDPVGFPSRPVSLYYSIDNGNSYQLINQDVENDGREWWWVGDKQDTTEARVKIEIVNLNNEIAIAESERFNIISIPYTYLLSILPSVLVGGTTQEISWQAYDAGNDLVSLPVSIYYSTDWNGPWNAIVTDQPAAGTYIWNVPLLNTDSAKLKIEAVDSEGNKGEDIWSFSIRSDLPSLGLISPNGGESLIAGQNYTIEWGVDNPIGLQEFPFTLYYSDNGFDCVEIAEGLGKHERSYDWLVPSLASSNVTIKLTMTDIFGQIYEDESSAPFTVSIPPIGKIYSPNGGEVLKGGGTFEVTWNMIGEGLSPSDYTVNIKYSVNDGEWQDIALGEINDGSYSWSLPAIENTLVKIKTEVVDAGGGIFASDESDSCFIIDSTPPAIVINRPQEGDVWENKDNRLRIAYQATDNVGIPAWGISLYYSNDGGTSYQYLTSLSFSGTVINDDNYRWIPSAIDTSDAKIKVEARDQAGWVTTVESETFTAVTFPDVDIISPGWGMTIWKGGTLQTITWSASDQGNDLISNPITIKFSSDEGQSWQVIASEEANDGSYTWLVPELDLSSWLGKIRVEAVDDDGHVGYDMRSLGIDSTPPAVTLTTPNGSENLYAGQNYYIGWEASDAVGLFTTSLYYSIDGGVNYSSIAPEVSCWCPYSWTLPEVDSSNLKVKIEVFDQVGHVATDESDAVFSIVILPFGTVLAPDGGEVYMSGYTISIQWKSGGDGIDPADYLINLSYQVDDGERQPIATGEANDGSYLWSPSDIDSSKVKVKVEAIKDGEVITIDESNDYFTIRGSYSSSGIIVKSPSSEEVWTAGSTYRISWEAASGYTLIENDPITIYLRYTFEDNLFLVFIAQDIPGTGNYFDWTIPSGIQAASATIEVSTWGWQYLYGKSETFSIVTEMSEKNVFRNPEGQEKVIFKEDSSSGVEWVQFERVEIPEEPMAGAEALEKALKISSNISELSEMFEIYMPAPSGADNLRVFRWDSEENKWIDMSAVQLGDTLIFESNCFGTFAVFEIVDFEEPRVDNLKINGRSVSDGDSINSKPTLQLDILDNYGVDASQTFVSVDGTEPKSLSGSQIEAAQTGSSISLSYTFSESEKLSLGDHTFKISAADEVGNTSVVWEATLHVVGDSISGLLIYPNPYKLGDPDYMKFDGLTEDIRVRIYDIAGDLVWSGQNTPGATSLTWNVTNSAGNQIAPGVYFYIAASNSGGKQSGRIAIIR